MLFTHDSSKGKHHMFLSLYLHYKKREEGEKHKVASYVTFDVYLFDCNYTILIVP